jgi:hypothetical protein
LSDDLPSSHKGKIGSLPASIREEVNRRIHNGETGPSICDWLNGEDEVLRVLDERWNEQPITPQNLSEWRKGGYRIYLANLERTSHLRMLSDRSTALVDAVSVNKLTGAGHRIAAGRLLELLERMEEGEGNSLELIEELETISKSVDRTEKNEIAREKVAFARDQLELRKEEAALNREKFESQTVEQFLKWQGSNAAREILESGKTKPVQTEALRQLFFGSMMSDDDE